jgi:spore coat protein U-like protein
MSYRNPSRAAVLALMVALGVLSAGAGRAATISIPRSASATLLVTADVGAQCRIGVDNLNFGAYDPLDLNARSDLLAESVIACTCTRGARTNILLDAGKFSADAASGRHMAAGSLEITYQLYRDPGRRAVWAGPGQTILSTTGRSARQLRVYASIPSGQRVLAGEYSDTVTAIVEF